MAAWRSVSFGTTVITTRAEKLLADVLLGKEDQMSSGSLSAGGSAGSYRQFRGKTFGFTAGT